MLVKDLIEKLKEFDGDLEIIFDSYSEMVYLSISGVSYREKPYDRLNPVVVINE